MSDQAGAEGNSPPRLFVHPLHLHYCSIISVMLERCKDMGGDHDGVMVGKAVRLAEQGYWAVERAILYGEKNNHLRKESQSGQAT